MQIILCNIFSFSIYKSTLIAARLKVLILAYFNNQYCHMQNYGGTGDGTF